MDSYKKNTWKSVVLSSLMFFVSLGVYQSEIIIGIVLLLTKIVINCLDNLSLRNHFKNWFKWAISLAIAGVLYLIVSTIFQRMYNTTDPVSYNSVANVKQLLIHGVLFKSIKEPVICYFDFFKYGILGNMFGKISILCNIFMLFITAIILLKQMFIPGSNKVKISITNKVIITLCIMMIPYIVMSITIMMQETEQRYYMNSGLIMFYQILLIILEKTTWQLKRAQKKYV